MFFQNPITFLFMIPSVLIALTVHEYAHAFVADKRGDFTPRALGRLSLNPFHHLNPIGTICMLLFGFGWANPVPINSRNFKNPRRDMALVAVAGPLSNFALSVIGALLYFVFRTLAYHIYLAVGATVLWQFSYYLSQFFYLFHYLNLAFFLFNLLPIPPLDGSRVLNLLLPPKASLWFVRHERQIYLIFLCWLIGGSLLYDLLIRVPAVTSSPVLMLILNIVSLTGWLSNAVSAVSKLILYLFSIIPIFSI